METNTKIETLYSWFDWAMDVLAKISHRHIAVWAILVLRITIIATLVSVYNEMQYSDFITQTQIDMNVDALTARKIFWFDYISQIITMNTVDIFSSIYFLLFKLTFVFLVFFFMFNIGSSPLMVETK